MREGGVDLLELSVPVDVFVYPPEEVCKFDTDPTCFRKSAMEGRVRIV